MANTTLRYSLIGLVCSVAVGSAVAAQATTLRVDRCSTQIGSTFKPTLTAKFGSEQYSFPIGEDGLTIGTAFKERRAIAWVRAKIGQPNAVATYTVCGQLDPRLDFNREND